MTYLHILYHLIMSRAEYHGSAMSNNAHDSFVVVKQIWILWTPTNIVCLSPMYIREYGSLYISIASDELKSLVIYTDMFLYTYTYSYLVFLRLPTPSRWPKIVVKVENQWVAKLAKSFSYFYYFPDKTFFCLFNYHIESSTIPVAFIVNFWS